MSLPVGEPRLSKGLNLMADKHWHIPISTRPTCPICKKAVYSRAGIHPQCAMIQAEPLRAEKNTLTAPAVQAAVEQRKPRW